ncbi:MAG: threonine synthase, partial [Acidimicrobiales bacterium]
RNGVAVDQLLTAFRADGEAEVDSDWVDEIRAEFEAGRLDDEGTLAEMRRMYEERELLIDPHTAVGTAVARRLRRSADVPMITLSTADPAKFPDAVEKATGIRPPLPAFLSELFDRPEYVVEIDNDLDAVAVQMRSL